MNVSCQAVSSNLKDYPLILHFATKLLHHVVLIYVHLDNQKNWLFLLLKLTLGGITGLMKHKQVLNS